MAGDRSSNQGGTEDASLTGVDATTRNYEEALAHGVTAQFELVLYVAGAAPCSMRAIANIRRLCAEYLPDCHELHVVDIYQEPAVAERDGILAVPALIKRSPLPRQTMVGDMTDFRRVLAGLGIMERVGGETNR